MTIDLSHWNSNLLPADRPDFDVDEYLQNTPDIEDFNLREKLEQWRDMGIVTFEACIDDTLIDSLLTDIQYLNDNRSKFELEVEHKGARYRLQDLPVPPLSDTGIKFNCLENISLAARRISLSGIVCEFLRHVFQDAPVVIQSLTFWRGSEQRAHLDYPWVCIQKKLPYLAASWTPLEDIRADAGPLAYYPGSHKYGVIPPFDWGNGSIRMEKDSTETPDDFVNYLAERIDKLNLKRQIFLPKRGDVLIWHGNVLHEGTAVKDRSLTRRSYVTHFTSLGAYPQDYHHPDALAAGRLTALNGGYVFDHPWVNDARELPSWKTSS
jgi:hypothetical protein